MPRTNCDECECLQNKEYGKWQDQSVSQYFGKNTFVDTFVLDPAGDYIRGDCCRAYPHQLVQRQKSDAFCYSGKPINETA